MKNGLLIFLTVFLTLPATPLAQAASSAEPDSEIKTTPALNLLISPLSEAVIGVDIKQLRSLLIQGQDPDEGDKSGNTPLTDAARLGLENFVEELVEAEADVNQTDELKKSPLMIASLQGHKKIVKMFLDYGANVRAKSKLNETALLFAASLGHTEIVRILIENGANIGDRDLSGNTPLMLAGRSRLSRCVAIDPEQKFVRKGQKL